MPDRATWICSSCEVTVRFAAGHTAKRPTGWAEDRGEWLCLTCRRVRAVEQALADSPLDADDPAARRLRRDALITFEVKRDAGQRNAAIAKVAATTPHHVAQQRRELVEQGVIERQVPGPKPAAKPKPAANARPKPRQAKQPTPLQQRIGAALKTDAAQTDKAVAAELGCSHATVAARRKALERAGAIPKTKRQGFAATRRSSPRVAARGGAS